MKHEARCARRRCCCASRLRTGAPAPGGPRLCRCRGGLRRQRPRLHACSRPRFERLRPCLCSEHSPRYPERQSAGGRASGVAGLCAAPSSAVSGSARAARFVLL